MCIAENLDNPYFGNTFFGNQLPATSTLEINLLSPIGPRNRQK